MWRQRLFWRLFITYSLITVFCTAIVGGLLVRGERRTSRAQLEADLAQLAHVLDERFGPTMDAAHAAVADSLAKHLGHATDTRITIIEADGQVLADTNVDPRQMENHRYRPEVQAALQGQVGSATRLSKSDFAPHLYVAVPSHAHPGWVMRVAIPMAAYQARLREATSVLALGGVLAGALSLLLGYVFMRRIVRPLEEVGRGLERLERGEFGARVPERGNDEIGTLARTLNRVEERLEATIHSLTAQRNQRDAILSSMVEGLLAVDGDDRILLANDAARHLLGGGSTVWEGRSLLEVARIPQLVQFVAQVRGSAHPLGTALVVREPRPRYLEVHAAPLRLADGSAQGAVVVFNDVTRLRKLEEVRREFVANVSHELKTPITAIQGFVETLLDGGALEDRESARRFLGILGRQSDRLRAIIEDLLYLSRIEYEEREMTKYPVDLPAVVERSVANFEHAARERHINLQVRIEAQHRTVQGDSNLLARAVDNLLDNAIKYSPAGGPVEVVLREAGDDVLLQVVDRGVGIPEEHLPRISERFYRVDPARSREMGGTGLGLAIVKHIARAHAGVLQVESRLGEGSTFTIRLPRGETA
jgi:two-component system phosphate regulon sensor histidine kinase PhoR